MKWIGKRISFVDDKDKLTVVIYPQISPMMKSLMGAWVAMWWAIGGIVIWALNKLPMSNDEVIAIYVFLAFWAYFAVKVTRSYLWLNFGRELIKIDETRLNYKKSIKNYGKATSYFLENIKQISVIQPKEKSVQSAWEKSFWIKGGERIEFEHMGKLVRFGRKIEKKDTELLFKLVTKSIEQRVRKLK